MVATFWGVRGSQATPGAQTVRYGGNTACVSLAAEDAVLVLDAGTGIRNLGLALEGGQQEVIIAVSHLHYDHICGFPLFAPLYEPGRSIHLVDYHRNGTPWSLLNLLDGIHFPLEPEHLPCAYRRVEGDSQDALLQFGFRVETIPVNHPGGAVGFRVDCEGGTFVYIPDNELNAKVPRTSRKAMAAFCRGADVLCHDAQYLLGELTMRHGWGHSCVQEVCDLAVAAQVRHLVLFHHDPDRTDEALQEIESQAQAYLAPHGIACTAAREGLSLDLAARPARHRSGVEGLATRP